MNEHTNVEPAVNLDEAEARVDLPKIGSRERYDARYVREEGAVDVIALTPRATDLAYTAATVWITKNDGLLQRIEIEETSGQRRTIILRNLTVNRRIAAREFRFSPPNGVQIVDR